MKCRDATDFLAEYITGGLSVDVHGTFERHLERCPNCREFVVQYRETIVAGRIACADASLPAVLPEELIEAILSAINAEAQD
jgi:anti-sigma factor RsiW